MSKTTNNPATACLAPRASVALQAYQQAEINLHTIEDQREAGQISATAYNKADAENKEERDTALALVFASHAEHLRDVDAKLDLLNKWLDDGSLYLDQREKLMICSIRRDLCALSAKRELATFTAMQATPEAEIQKCKECDEGIQSKFYAMETPLQQSADLLAVAKDFLLNHVNPAGCGNVDDAEKVERALTMLVIVAEKLSQLTGFYREPDDAGEEPVREAA